MDKQRLRNELGSFLVEDDGTPDTLAIVLCTYFSDHRERPKDDPDTENGWGQWVEYKTNDALEELANLVQRLHPPQSGAGNG